MLATLLETKAGYSGWLASASTEDGDAVYAALDLEPGMEVRLLEIDQNEWRLQIVADSGVFLRVADAVQVAHIRVRACKNCWVCGACHVS